MLSVLLQNMHDFLAFGLWYTLAYCQQIRIFVVTVEIFAHSLVPLLCTIFWAKIKQSSWSYSWVYPFPFFANESFQSNQHAHL